MKAVIIAGSQSDEEFVKNLFNKLSEQHIECQYFFASAHKQPTKVLEILEQFKNKAIVYVTVAGMSNALSGFVAANSDKPTIACPSFKDQQDMMVNIHSSLQMPSNVPAMTILRPDNCALSIKRMFALNSSE